MISNLQASLKAAKALRDRIMILLEKQPGLNNPEICAALDIPKGIEARRVSAALCYLLKHREVHADTTNGNLFRYSVSDGERYVKHIPSDQLPHVTGIVYSPIGWCVHQLQGMV